MTTASPVTKSGAPPLKSQLRPAILHGPEALSNDAKREIQSLAGARPIRFFTELLITWLTIAIIIAIGLYVDNVFVTALCVPLISTRQLVLGLLMHEQVHRLGLRSRYADWFVNVFAVYPLFVTTVEDYAKVHLSHHKYCFTQKDPDFIRKSGDEWTFPKEVRKILVIILRDITGMNIVKLIRGKTASSEMTEFTRRNPSPVWLRVGFFIVLITTLTLVHGWMAFLVYWVLPILTFTQLLVRWIAVGEHMYNHENATIYETTPLLQLKPWQKLLLPDLNFGLHAYHHMHPGISFGSLPRVHEIYVREGLVDETAIFRGQAAYLKFLVRNGC